MAEKMRTVIPAGNQATGDNADYGIVYAYISQLDLDGGLDNCLVTRW